MRNAAWTWVIVAGAAVPAMGSEPAVPETTAMEAGFLEFLAEEAGVDEDVSEALMSAELDRALEQSASQRRVKDDGKDK
jgi:heme oxygenase